jgi:hypothetical protein
MTLFNNLAERQAVYDSIDQFYTGDPYDDAVYNEAKILANEGMRRAHNIAFSTSVF